MSPPIASGQGLRQISAPPAEILAIIPLKQVRSYAIPFMQVRGEHMSNYTFKEFQAEYPTDAACLDRIMYEQYGGTQFFCPSCGAESKFSRIAKRRAYACQWCGHHIYPCVGTIFEKSRTPLTNWFFAMYLMTSTRHGVAAKELERQIGCTYKTAWRMAHELRKLMAAADHHGPMRGHVEVDETRVGGRETGSRSRKGKPSEKTVVFGMLQRDGIVRAGPVPDVRALSSDIRNCTGGDIENCTTWLVGFSRFELRREA
jgi:predicted RNA-binding Zn-ribbon protein involved in translation (DUF1610 family)